MNSSFVRILILGLTSALVFVACGGNGDGDVDPVEAAQARVNSAQKSVTDAQDAFDKAGVAFCQDSKDYIATIDRYGKVFDDSKVTVGDVKTAGADLVAPKKAVKSSAANVTDAQKDLTDAKKELADAEAALASAKSGGSSTAPSSTTTSAPVVSAATIDRVEQAESDFSTASAGITDQTALTDAAATFNSAAFALEVAWLRLFADAGCLSDEQHQKAVTALVDYTVALQTALKTAGYYDGEVDGIYGPSTVSAVEKLQAANDLPETGYVDAATAVALDAAVGKVNGESASNIAAYTASVQSTLKLAGYWTGPVDGKWTPELTDALKKFQTALGVEPTGSVDAATLHALEQAIASAKEATTATTAEVTTTTAG